MNKKAILIVGIVGSLAIGGVVAKNALGTKNQSVLMVLQDKVTKEQARAIALERVKGEVVDEEYEKEHGKMVYGFEIKQADGTFMEVKVDEMTGKIIFVGKDDADAEDNDSDDSMQSANKSEKRDKEDNDEAEESEASLMKQAKITKAEAEAIALKKAAGTVEDGELEMEHGKLVYSFDIRNKKGTITEVQVDAKTGKIVSVEEEDAAKEAAEKKQDVMKKGKNPD